MSTPDERAAKIAQQEGTLTDATLEEVERRALQGYPRGGYAQRSAREIAMVAEIRRHRATAAANLRAAPQRAPEAREALRERIAEELYRIDVEDARWGRRSPRYWRDAGGLAKVTFRNRADRILALLSERPDAPGGAGLCDHAHNDNLPDGPGGEREPVQVPSCGVCGGAQVEVRPRYPGGAPRVVCPTCLADRLASIHEVSSPRYGVAAAALRPAAPHGSSPMLTDSHGEE